jgi:uncharacterized protein YjbI with pentapeptide repeats
MTEIRHRATGQLLRVVVADSLAGADLRDDIVDGAELHGAVLRHADVNDANFRGVSLVAGKITFANFSHARNAEVPAFKQNLR